MSEAKYYNYSKERPLNLEQDGCELSEWHQNSRNKQFAIHPDGFKIFLSHDKLDASDEYSESDPYEVEQKRESEFQKRRFEITKELADKAVSAIKGRPNVLDLGCGEGHITEKIRQTLNEPEMTGLDYSISAISYAHEHFPEIDFAVGDAYNSPYVSNYFDLVLCNNLWEHVPDPLHLLKRIKHILKPGGHLIISTPSRYRTRNLVRVLTGRPVVFNSEHHVTEYTVGQVKEQLRYGGFTTKKVVSKPLWQENVKSNIAKWVFSKLTSLVGSHHRLESTVFYLAKNRKGITE